MESKQGNTLLSLQNVQAYLSENAATLGDVISTETRAALDDSISELSEHAAVQDGHLRTARGTAARQREKRAELIRDHMAPISRIAKLKLENTPALIAFTIPKNRPSAERLAALADGMAKAAEPFADVFVRAGCKPEFIQNLRIAADELLATLHERALSRGIVREATSALHTKLSRARKVLHVIDGFLRSALANDPDRLANWKLVKRVPKPHYGPNARTTTNPVPATGTPGPVAIPAPVRLAAAA